MATLAYSIEVEGLEDETLVVRGFHGQESLSNSVFLGQACYGFATKCNWRVGYPI